MDRLKSKQFKNYDYTSRYSSTPYYYDTQDHKFIYGIGSQLNQVTAYVVHKVKDTDTLDYLALKYYNNPTYYWVIAYFNDIQDCYEPLISRFKTIKIPNITSIAFGGER